MCLQAHATAWSSKATTPPSEGQSQTTMPSTMAALCVIGLGLVGIVHAQQADEHRYPFVGSVDGVNIDIRTPADGVVRINGVDAVCHWCLHCNPPTPQPNPANQSIHTARNKVKGIPAQGWGASSSDRIRPSASASSPPRGAVI